MPDENPARNAISITEINFRLDCRSSFAVSFIVISVRYPGGARFRQVPEFISCSATNRDHHATFHQATSRSR
jgi:hypothetical protein